MEDSLTASSSYLQEPLHTRVRRILRRQLLHDFADGDRFYSERELIKKLNVSQPTVRRAMLDLATEGYLIASPRRGFFVRKRVSKKHVGVFAPGYKFTTGISRMEFLANACREEDVEFHSYYLHSEDSVDDALKMIRNKPADERIILTGLSASLTRSLLEKLNSHGYSYLVANYVPPGYSGRFVGLDEEAGFKMILNHLQSLGHARMLFLISESTELMSTNQRLKALEKQLAALSCKGAKIVSCGTKNWTNSFETTYHKIGELLNRKPWPTAICPLSGVGAWAVLRYCIQHGIKIPEEISLVCYDPLPATDLLPIALTELSHSEAELTKEAVKLVWSDEPTINRKLLMPELIVRASTGPASKKGRTTLLKKVLF